MSETNLQNDPDGGKSPSPGDIDDDLVDDEHAPEEEDSDEDGASADPDREAEETKARARGWKPKEEWRGKPPPNFIDDPKEYNAQHELHNAKLRAENEQFRHDIKELKADTKQLLEQSLASKNAEIERLKADAMKRMRAAVAVADENAYADAEADLKAAENIRPAQPPAPGDQTQQQPGQQPQFQQNQPVDPNYRAWHERNPWYKTDPERTRYAEFVAQDMQRQGMTPQMGMAYYDAIGAAVEKTFGPTGGRRQPSNRQSNAGGAPPGNKKSFDSLPADAKSAFKRMATKHGLYENNEKGRAEYAKAYFEEQAQSPFARAPS